MRDRKTSKEKTQKNIISKIKKSTILSDSGNEHKYNIVKEKSKLIITKIKEKEKNKKRSEKKFENKIPSLSNNYNINCDMNIID